MLMTEALIKEINLRLILNTQLLLISSFRDLRKKATYILLLRKFKKYLPILSRRTNLPWRDF